MNNWRLVDWLGILPFLIFQFSLAATFVLAVLLALKESIWPKVDVLEGVNVRPEERFVEIARPGAPRSRGAFWSLEGLLGAAVGLLVLDLVYLIAGAMIELGVRSVADIPNHTLGSNIIRYIVLLFLTLFLLAPFALLVSKVFGRRWVLIDGLRHEVTVRWWLWTTLRKRLWSLDDFTTITVTRQKRRPRGGGTKYVVELEGTTVSLTIERYRSYRLACELAEIIAESTELPVRNYPAEQFPARPVTARTSLFSEESGAPPLDCVPSPSSSRLEYQSGGGVALIVVGLSLLAISLPLAWSMLSELYGALRGPWTTWTALVAVFKTAAMSLFLFIVGVIAFCGAWLPFIRCGLRFDKDRCIVTSWSRWLFVKRTTVNDLKSYAEVRIERTAGNYDKTSKYFIFLTGPDGSCLGVATVDEHDAAEKIGNELADFLGLPLRKTVAEVSS